MDHTQIWQQALSEITSLVDGHRFHTWFKPLIAEAGDGSPSLRLRAPNKFVADFLQEHYHDKIMPIIQRISPEIRSLAFIPDGAPSALPVEPAPQDTPLPEVPRASRFPGLNRRFAFESFVVGPGNEFAKSAALAVAEAPGKTKFNPLLIYGGVGLGKTHLLQGIGNYVLANYSGRDVQYLTSEEFYLGFIEAIKSNNTKVFTQRYRVCDLLLVDDIQFFAGKESTQEEFFYIFNSLYQNGRQIVLTSDLPPSSLKGLQERLVSRFQWGLCVDIQPPDLETRVAILKKKAEEDNLSIPENVLYFIGENISSNIRELEGIVIRLLAYASISKTDITIDLVKTLIAKAGDKERSKISVDDIIQAVADYYKVPVDNVREKNRRKEVALCRQVAMFVAKAVTSHSLKTIGLHFGGRDHSTVIHALQQIELLRKSDPSVQKDVDYIISLFTK